METTPGENELAEQQKKIARLKKIITLLFIISIVGGIVIMFAEYMFFQLFWQ